MMIIDCGPELTDRLIYLLDNTVTEGAVQYDIHVQSEALTTYVAPSAHASDRMHFVDGSEGGYIAASAHMR